MKSKPVFPLDAVAFDLKVAITHYASWRLDAESHVIEKYTETTGWIGWNPGLFPIVFGRVQRAILKDSYYIVYFLQEDDRSLVLAVLDGRMNPTTIRKLVTLRGLTSR